MLWSRVSNHSFRAARRSHTLQTRSFHILPHSQFSAADISSSIPTVTDALSYAPLDHPGWLMIPLAAAVPNAIRIWRERINIRARLEDNRLKPLMQAYRSLDTQLLAVGKPPFIPAGTHPFFVDGMSPSKMNLFGGNLLPAFCHLASTFTALVALRRGTSYYQTFFEEPVASLITYLTQDRTVADVLSNFESYLSFVEPATILSYSPILLCVFCLYQYYRIFVSSQFWKGWRYELLNVFPLLQMKAYLHNDRYVYLPQWVYVLQRTHIAKMTGSQGFTAFILGNMMLGLLSQFNLAQLLFLATSSTFARFRAGASRRYEHRLVAKQAEESTKWEPLQPVKRKG